MSPVIGLGEGVMWHHLKLGSTLKKNKISLIVLEQEEMPIIIDSS